MPAERGSGEERGGMEREINEEIDGERSSSAGTGYLAWDIGYGISYCHLPAYL
jgi:hypothetical protein